MRTASWTRWLAVLSLGAGIVAITPRMTCAQEAPQADNQTTTIIIRDGTVTVNGEEVTEDTRTLRVGPDGQEVVIVRTPQMRAFAPFRFNDEFSGVTDAIEAVRVNAPNFAPVLNEFVFAAEQSTETIQLERESMELARRARAAEGAERAQLEQELRAKLEEAFQAKLEVREERVQRLEDQLNEQQNLLEERRRNQNEIIERRLNDLMGQEDALDW
jgi:hypothetical protein